jgi:hypothetical protein
LGSDDDNIGHDISFAFWKNRAIYSDTRAAMKPLNHVCRWTGRRRYATKDQIKGETMGIILRWLGAFLLLSATYNPTQINFTRWAEANWQTQMPLTLLLGLLLGVGYMIYIGATLRSIGTFGILLVGAIVAALVWVLIDYQILTLQNPSLNLWLGILALSVVLGIGLSWSIIRQRISGQATVDEVQE